VFDKQLAQGADGDDEGEGSSSASKRTIDTVTAGERLIETLELAEEEVKMVLEYEQKVAEALVKQGEARRLKKEEAAKKKAKKGKGKRGRQDDDAEEEEEEEAVSALVPRPQSNPLMLGLSAPAYVLRALKMVKAQHLEEALLVLPFNAVEALLRFLNDLIVADGGKVRYIYRHSLEHTNDRRTEQTIT
jgi:U3 small nucleolar RNA-associated protein 12